MPCPIRVDQEPNSGDWLMKILDVLTVDTINVNLRAKDKKAILDELVAPAAKLAGASHDELVRVLLERERLGSTGIGGGIGIPHGKLRGLPSLILGFGLSRQGVDFESMDGRPTHLFFLLLTPEDSAGLHLKLLARLSRLLKNDDFKRRLMQAGTPNEVINAIRDEDEDF
jgi:PTS system nitrogen regulatory IIA component